MTFMLLLTTSLLADSGNEYKNFSQDDLAAAQAVLKLRAANDQKPFNPAQGRSAITALYGLVTSKESFTQAARSPCPTLTFPDDTDAQILKFNDHGDAYMRFYNESGKEDEQWIDQKNMMHFAPTTGIVTDKMQKHSNVAKAINLSASPINLAASPSDPKKGKWFKVIERSRAQALEDLNSAHSHMAGEAWGFAAGSGVVNAAPGTPGAIAAVAADIGILTGWWYRCEAKYNQATEVKNLIDNLSHEFHDLMPTLTADMMVMRIIPAAARYVARAAKQKALGAAWKAVNKALGDLDKLIVDGFNSAIQRTPQAAITRVRPDPRTIPREVGLFDGIRFGWTRDAADVGQRSVQNMERTGEELAARATGMVRERVTGVLGEEVASRTAEEGAANFPIIGSIINASIGLGMMRWSCGKVNDDFLDDYTRTINAVHDAVRDAILAAEVHDGDAVFLQTHLGENFGVDDKGACWESCNRGTWERWYIEKNGNGFASQGPAVRHRDQVYLKSMSSGAATGKYLGVNSSGQMFMSADKGKAQTFILAKDFCAISPDDDAVLDTIVHDTDAIYLASCYNQHHNDPDHQYTELIGFDDQGKFCTSADKTSSQCLAVSRDGDAQRDPVWKVCPTCGGSGTRGIFGPSGFGWFPQECPTCHGKRGWVE